MTFDQHTELQLLEALENEPETTQADLAAKAGVAVGTVNWYIKRWSKKGMVIVKRMDRWRWHYLLTPQGMAEKAQLTRKYIEASMLIYRQTRTEASMLLEEIVSRGYDAVIVGTDGDIADICRLTCLEFGVDVLTDNHKAHSQFPTLILSSTSLQVEWPQQSQKESSDDEVLDSQD